MKDKKEKIEKIDLLSLPPSERLRMCREIRNALKVKVSEAKILLSKDVLIADKTMLAPEKEPTCEKPSITDISQNSTLINNLLKKIW